MATSFVHRGPCGLVSGCTRQGRQSLRVPACWLSAYISSPFMRQSRHRLPHAACTNALRSKSHNIRRPVSRSQSDQQTDCTIQTSCVLLSLSLLEGLNRFWFACYRIHCQRQGLVVCAGWGADIVWSKGSVVEASKAAEGVRQASICVLM
jgi:hypothetical protein